MIKKAIYKLLNRENLSLDEAKDVMDEIMGGKTTNAQNSILHHSASYEGAKP